MKLPENKTERTKILVLAGIVGVALLYVLVMFVGIPFVKARKENAAKIEELRVKVEEVREKIRKLKKDVPRNCEIVTNIKTNAEKFVLMPTLGGNYLLGASEIMTQMSKRSGVPIEPPAEIGQADIALPPGRTTPNSFKMYIVRVTTKCGMRHLVALLREIERSSPYVSIGSISIASDQQQGNTEVHNVTFEVQWPIWVDPGIPARLEDQLKKEADRKGAVTNAAK